MRKLRSIAAGLLALGAAFSPALAQEPPAAGASPRIEAIRKAGVLKVGVLANLPWLAENTTGTGGEAWSGPAWILAKEYARLLNVKLEPVLVSHETKVPVLASNQVDITISPLAETPERAKVIDFVIYSTTSVCLFGRADNARFFPSPADVPNVLALQLASSAASSAQATGFTRWRSKPASSARWRSCGWP